MVILYRAIQHCYSSSMRAVKVVALLLGLFLLFWIVRKIGLQELLTGFQMLGWRLFIPVLIFFLSYLLYTFSWQIFLKRFEHYAVPFWNLFRIKVSGEAANTLTPLNFAGGDPVRIWLLSKRMPVSISGASVVVDRTLQTLAIVALVFLGNVAAAVQLDLPPYARRILAGTAVFLLCVILFFLYYQTRGLFRKLASLAQKLRLKRFNQETVEKIEEVDRHILDFYRQDRLMFAVCFLLHFGGRLCGVMEIYAIGRFLGVPMGAWEALFFAAVIPMTNMVSGIVPGTFGVLEGVMSSLFYALHWNPADGVILQIARRLRSLTWILLGLLFIWIFKSRDRARKLIVEEEGLSVDHQGHQ